MTAGVRTARDHHEVWGAYLTGGAERTVIATVDAAMAVPVPPVTARQDATILPGDETRPVQAVYPKRSDLRRAESRGGGRGRKPAARPQGPGPHPGRPNVQPPARARRPTTRSGPPAAQGPAFTARDAGTQPRGITVAPEARVTRATPVIPPPLMPFDGGPVPPPMPPELAPPVDGPAGFHTRPGSGETRPIARVGDAQAPLGPVTGSVDPAAWSADTDAAPRRSGRRRGEPDTGSVRVRPGRPPQAPATGSGRHTTSAAKLLVLALVVGFEGLAVTSLAKTANVAPPERPDLDDAAAAAMSSALLADSETRQRAHVEAQQAAVTTATAHTQSAGAKVAAAFQQAKIAADKVRAAAEARQKALREAQENPKAAARVLLADRGWSSSQFDCLDKLWTKESRWNYRATNPSSGAYGIPQSLPGTKMASAGSDWRTNPVTQIRWGLDYIDDRYGTPCGAWGHSVSHGWY